MRLHDLRYNSLEGSILVSLFSIPSLQRLQLSNDPFFSQVDSEGTLCLLSTTKLAGLIFFTISELEETHSTSGTVIDWNYIIAELGFIFGLGIAYWPLIFSMRWRESGISNTLMDFFFGCSLNCILENSIIKDEHIGIRGRGATDQ